MTIAANSMRTSTLLRTLTCATAALLALTACTDSSSPATVSPSSTSATPEPTETTLADPSPTDPTLEPPEYPKGIDEFTEENAIKFVRFYFEQLTYSTNVGVPDELYPYQSESCDWCAFWSREIAETTSDGSSFVDFNASVIDSTASARTFGEIIVVSVQIKNTPYSVHGKDGTNQGLVSADTQNRDIAVGIVDRKWMVFDYGQLEEKLEK